jgi:hypothetical protein
VTGITLHRDGGQQPLAHYVRDRVTFRITMLMRISPVRVSGLKLLKSFAINAVFSYQLQPSIALLVAIFNVHDVQQFHAAVCRLACGFFVSR